MVEGPLRLAADHGVPRLRTGVVVTSLHFLAQIERGGGGGGGGGGRGADDGGGGGDGGGHHALEVPLLIVVVLLGGDREVGGGLQDLALLVLIDVVRTETEEKK